MVGRTIRVREEDKRKKRRCRKEGVNIVKVFTTVRNYYDEEVFGPPVQIRLTDHAILRYLERIEKLDLQPLRDKIKNIDYQIVQYLRDQGIDFTFLEELLVTEDLRKLVTVLGTGTYPLIEGVQGRIVNNCIVTIFGKERYDAQIRKEEI